MQSTNRLAIGSHPLKQKSGKARQGQYYDCERGRPTSLSEAAKSLLHSKFVVIGESHDHPEHHLAQAAIIRELHRQGASVIVGMEMFDRTKQFALDEFSLGRLSDEEFVERSAWKTQWGFDFNLYKPIFDAVRQHRLRLVALNVPRTTVSKVGREGWSALTEDERMGIPDPDLTNGEHRQLFAALMAGHPPTGDRGERIYSAQVLWDTGMADSALKYWERTPKTDRTIFAIIAGNGHAMYGLGINLRLAMRTNEKISTVVCLEAEGGGQTFQRSIADVVYIAAPHAR